MEMSLRFIAEHIIRLRVSKSVTLMGLDTGEGLPVIDASGSSSAITLMANGSTVERFNLTGSEGCGCGDAGINVASSNNLIRDNIIYKNKYGVYIKPGYVNNTIVSNDLLDNKITASRRWWQLVEQQQPEFRSGTKSLVELFTGKQMKGNHYSDYDEPKEGCNDTNEDGFCDQPRKIDGGSSVDLYPSFFKENS